MLSFLESGAARRSCKQPDVTGCQLLKSVFFEARVVVQRCPKDELWRCTVLWTCQGGQTRRPLDQNCQITIIMVILHSHLPKQELRAGPDAFGRPETVEIRMFA